MLSIRRGRLVPLQVGMLVYEHLQGVSKPSGNLKLGDFTQSKIGERIGPRDTTSKWQSECLWQFQETFSPWLL
jgi:hypothetical protein